MEVAWMVITDRRPRKLNRSNATEINQRLVTLGAVKLQISGSCSHADLGRTQLQYQYNSSTAVKACTNLILCSQMYTSKEAVIKISAEIGTWVLEKMMLGFLGRVTHIEDDTSDRSIQL